MNNLTQLSYMILAPISVIGESFLLYGFLRLKQTKEHPEIMIFWQCLSQLILDIHWFTGIEAIKASLSAAGCQFLGSFCLYFYYLSWDYTVFLSIEILLKILNPHQTGYKKRSFWYHIVSHLTSLIIFIVLMTGDNNGNSIMKTCFVQRGSVYELVVLIPAVLHFPICMCVVGYTIYISYNTFYVKYLKYHMLVVVTFSIAWVPISLVHGLNYHAFNIIVPRWFVIIAVLLGGPSGFLLFLSRMQQKGLFGRILNSIIHPTAFQNSMYAELKPEILLAQNISSYSQLFTTVTSKAIADILFALTSVLEKASDALVNNSADHWEWTFTYAHGYTKKYQITQYNFVEYRKIIEFYGLDYSLVAESLNYANNLDDIEKRCKAISGRSGAFFYYTQDGEYIVKTITNDELEVMKAMAKEYCERLCCKDGTHLAKILGVFRIKVDTAKAFKVIVMENLASGLEAPLMYDLKGSKLDRRVTESLYKNLDEIPRNKVYKDIDFFNTFPPVYLDNEKYSTTMKSIENDVNLLEKFSIMDYSMLLIIEEVPYLKGSMANTRNYVKFGKYLMYIGIIDYLQTYTIYKKLEHNYKALKGNCSVTVSSISPAPYKNRFLSMLKRVFIANIIN